MKFEDLSPAAQRGLDNFRAFLRNGTQDGSVRVAGIQHGGGKFSVSIGAPKKDAAQWASGILMGFCLANGATFIEAHNAVRFAESHTFWVVPGEPIPNGKFPIDTWVFKG